MFTQSLQIAKKSSTAKSLIPPKYTEFEDFKNQFASFFYEDLTFISINLDIVSFRKKHTDKLTKDFSAMTFSFPGTNGDLTINSLIHESEKYEFRMNTLPEDTIEKRLNVRKYSYISNSKNSSINKSRSSIDESTIKPKRLTDRNSSNQTSITQINPDNTKDGYNLLQKYEKSEDTSNNQISKETFTIPDEKVTQDPVASNKEIIYTNHFKKQDLNKEINNIKHPDILKNESTDFNQEVDKKSGLNVSDEIAPRDNSSKIGNGEETNKSIGSSLRGIKKSLYDNEKKTDDFNTAE